MYKRVKIVFQFRQSDMRESLFALTHVIMVKQFQQIFITRLILNQQNNLIHRRVDFFFHARHVAGFGFLLEQQLRSQNRLNPRRRTGIRKIHAAEQVCRIGNRHRRHIVFHAGINELRDFHRAFQKRILRMHM